MEIPLDNGSTENTGVSPSTNITQKGQAFGLPDRESQTGFEHVEATQSDLVRSSQKDSYYTGQIYQQLSEVTSFFVGARATAAPKQRQRLQVISQLIYSLLTTLRGEQTLGEEYVGIMQYDSKRNMYPSLAKRAISVLLSLFAGTMARALLKFAGKVAWPSSYDPVTLDKTVDGTVAALSRLHLGLFYLFGRYYDLGKRLVHIELHKLRRIAQGELRSGYELLGVLAAIQVIVAATRKTVQYLRARSNPSVAGPLATTKTADKADCSKSDLNFGYSSAPCNLCLSALETPTLTACGHVFCWACVSEWLSSNNICPLCRQHAKQSHLILLCGY
ncbi:hypothetical protein BB561_002355 [Smittium simulii]|uniref:RING-type E3 ubiquitin transferase n=1 Tax=Smittium simulii TaxID=133385 RepID=A0A2T9YQQ1_9FUNG|nr:hypothetical protein BB561_002355 [Smittium simulii]